MEIKIQIDLKMKLYHSVTMKELNIDKTVERCYNVESQEYLALCEEYASTIGILREENETLFDKEMAKILVEEAKRDEMETIKKIEDTVARCYLHSGVSGCVKFGGYIINPKDFCAICVSDFNIKASKK